MIKIETENNQFIEFEEASRTFFYGSNQKLKRQLVRSLKRFATGKSLSELEEIVYGENGIEIYIDGKQVKKGNIDFLFIQDNQSIYQEIDFIKKSMMFDYLQELKEDILISEQIEKLNDELLKLELLVNKSVERISDNVSSNFSSFNLENIFKNQLFLSFEDSEHEYPLEMMDANELLDEYLNLLEAKIKREKQMIWLSLVNPESFLITDNIRWFMDGLEEISERTGLLKVFIFANQAIDIEYKEYDFPHTVILLEQSHLLPELSDFKRTIENYYPIPKEYSELELLGAFYDLVDDIGTTGKISEHMVLLKVINGIFGFDDLNYFYKIKELSEAEKSFLLDRS
ncbi:MAG: hypothetical protein FWE43_02725 [Streptococcaceae bacterium]|nr:hypothetical protein [Streptococcaceae bacterium]MCL2681386.1 hypothetical protein [Streptococcaceae bacterium]